MKNPLIASSNKIILIFALLLMIPIALWAQSGIESALTDNAGITDLLALISPMAISPFLTLFITSVASYMGWGNAFIAENPVLGNGFVLALSFILLIITTLPNLTKVSKPIGIAANFLENKAGIIIYIIILAAPFLFGDTSTSQYGESIHFGFFDMPFGVILMICIAIPYFVIVMTVRVFLEIIIFLSPIPLIDAFFEFMKKVVTVVLLGIYFVSPVFGFVISVLMFFVAYLFFKRAKRTTNHFLYVYAEPIIHKLLGKKKELIHKWAHSKLTKEIPVIDSAIKCLTMQEIGGIHKKEIAWLVSSGPDLFVCKIRSFRKPIIEYFHEASITMQEDMYFYIVEDENQTLKILINNSYRPLVEDIKDSFSINSCEKIGLAKRKEDLKYKGKMGIRGVLNFFNSQNIRTDKGQILEK